MRRHVSTEWAPPQPAAPHVALARLPSTAKCGALHALLYAVLRGAAAHSPLVTERMSAAALRLVTLCARAHQSDDAPTAPPAATTATHLGSMPHLDATLSFEPNH